VKKSKIKIMKTISRRKFVKSSLQATAAAAIVLPMTGHAEDAAAFSFSQIQLPYDYKALEPHIDAMTMEIHYTKHHAAYIKNVNEAIAAEKLSYESEMDFFKNASKLSAKARNNSGGAWNHNFFWQVIVWIV
jgi:superoxide dismutase, Fe-Mn family